ncbi:hypothetical protein LUZ63_014616 [Rhynchospora breviuscula]|uniref:Remorin C-terminal domain-containing protein n=1 Tax=Rhynchospora breviuscula TaxID=2022672 RepID=A0A9Q0HLA4_9POAL|nr:hypothetical protein LUZ63_014616 [Rhynchospora breviuscula]
MEYERIAKPLHQGGGFSPKKLRAMLLGVEKRRKEEEEEIESKFTLKTEIDDRRGSLVDECKDVDMVSSVSDPSSSSEPELMTSEHRSKDAINPSSRILKPQEDDSFDSESVASNFEFHKDNRNPNPNRSPIAPPFSKHTPSKWADAQKWIASPNLSRVGRGGKKPERVGMKNPVTKVMLEATMEEAETKRVDLLSQEKREIVVLNNKPANLAPDPYPEMESYPKPAPVVLADSAVSLSRHDPSVSLHNATAFIPPSTVRSVSMRDMGTEMTPIASQEPSRTGTPVRPASPNPSTSTSPRRSLTGADPDPNPNPNPNPNTNRECNNEGLSEKEIQMKTRREIIALGTQLGKSSIAAWASKQEEEKDASKSLQSLQVGSTCQSVVKARAAAWEEAEKAKYIARFKREEIKIHAWEDHQKAKIEAEMRKVEVEVEKMRAHAQERLMDKLADTRHKAEEKRAVAEAKRTHAATRTAEQADYIRRTGRVPSTFFSCSCWGWCS